MQIHPISATLGKTSLLCISLVVLPAFADEADLFDLSLESLMQVRITSATKSPQSVRDIAASVTLLTRQDIARYGDISLEELLSNMPGFYHVDNYEDYLLGVRGTTGGSIAFLINGVQQHPTRIKGLSVPDRSRMNIPLQSIDRIEIIRGPAAVIYGNNAFSGSINIVTNAAENPSHILSIAGGDNNRQQAFSRSGVQGDDYQLRLNIGAEQNDGIGGKFSNMMSPAQLAAMDPAMRDGLDGTLPQRNVNADLNGHYRQLEFGLRYSEMHYGFYAITPAFHDGNDLHLNTWLGNLAYQYDLSADLQTRSTLTLSHEFYQFKPDFAFANIGGQQSQGARRLEFEQTLNYKQAEQFNLVAGVNYRRLYAVSNRVEFPDVGFDVDLMSDDINTAGLFTDIKYQLAPSWSLVGGYRFSRTDAYNIARRENTDNSVFSFPVRQDHVHRAALIYAFDAENQLKIMHSNALQDNSAKELQEPEKITSREINYLYAGALQSVSLSVFDNNVEYLKRRTVRLVGSDLVTQVDNSGEWQNRGIEAIYTYRPGRNLQAELSAVTQRTVDTAADNAVVGNSPAHLFKSKFSYAKRDFTYAASLVYVSEMQADYSVDTDNGTISRLGDAVPAYWLLGANLRYQQPGAAWFLNLHVYNLTDSEVRYPANELADFEQGALGRRREVLFSSGISF